MEFLKVVQQWLSCYSSTVKDETIRTYYRRAYRFCTQSGVRSIQDAAEIDLSTITNENQRWVISKVVEYANEHDLLYRSRVRHISFDRQTWARIENHTGEIGRFADQNRDFVREALVAAGQWSREAITQRNDDPIRSDVTVSITVPVETAEALSEYDDGLLSKVVEWLTHDALEQVQSEEVVVLLTLDHYFYKQAEREALRNGHSLSEWLSLGVGEDRASTPVRQYQRDSSGQEEVLEVAVPTEVLAEIEEQGWDTGWYLHNLLERMVHGERAQDLAVEFGGIPIESVLKVCLSKEYRRHYNVN